MNRNPTHRRLALDATKELIESLNLSADERQIVLGIAVDKYESVSAALKGLGMSDNCVSAIFAAALEYSETIIREDEDE
jgi:hypothetical protein